MMPARPRRAIIGLSAAALLALFALALLAPASYATITHRHLFSFDGSNGTEQLGLNAAVDNSAGPSGGDVYVGLGSGNVFKFEADGTYAGVEITGAETPAESFSFLSFPYTSGIAVDGSGGANAGDLYVADIEHGVIDRFAEDGTYLCQITGAESPSPSECNGVAGSKTPDGSITPRGLAVDSAGDLYVADLAHDVIDKFSPSGEYLEQISDPIAEPGSLALDPGGDIYVSHGPAFGGAVERLEADGTVVTSPELEALSAYSLAVDPTGGQLLVAESGGQISEFEPSGTRLDGFGAGGLALALGAASGEVYANGEASFLSPQIDVFGPLTVLPEVTTEAATEVEEDSATLNGLVTPDSHPGGEVTECHFDYVDDADYNASAPNPYSAGQSAPCAPAPPFTTPTALSAAVSLAPSTTYHFRLLAEDAGGGGLAGGPGEGADQTLTTPGPPGVGGESSTPSARQATVRARINPFGSDTSCRVQYVDQASFDASGYAGATTLACSPSSLAAGFGERGVSAQLGGLHVDTTYHFRFIATNGSPTTTGADQTFVTFGVKEFSVEVLDEEGNPYTQAGGHPYKIVTNFEFNKSTDLTGKPATDANPKDIIAALPPGFVGNVNATAKCTPAELVRRVCSGAAQVGRIDLRLDSEENLEPLYNLVPPPGYPAALGFRIGTFVNVYIYFKLRTGGDYGITAESLNSSTASGLEGATVEIWGVPADPSHDAQRVCENQAPPCSVHAPLRPFLTTPTSCDGPQSVGFRADSWQAPGDFVSAAATLPPSTGCDLLSFAPGISIQPDTSAADSPSGLRTKLQVPQSESPGGLAQSTLRRTVVNLPDGLTVSPSSAGGLAACTPAEIGLHNAAPPGCPDASKIGSVEIDTPLLEDPLKGAVYLAQQNANPFGSLLAIYVAAQADGALVKLAGHVLADPLTGQLRTTFEDTPQLPFGEFKLDLFGGPRAALATPEQCGTFTTNTSLGPWSATAPVSLSSAFTLSSGCVDGFAPAFSAGTTSPQAGAYSPFVLSFSRSDTDQELSRADVSLPPGLLAKLAGVAQCSDSEAAAGGCPEASRVGAVRADAGPGPSPLQVSGNAYLTGPYKGAPYGLAVVVPAIAGPFDLGTVVVRQALHVDPNDAHVTAVSDPFPTILAVAGSNGQINGFPIRLRRVEVSIDRPDFTLNPTNCNPMAVSASFVSKEGRSASQSSPFQVANCTPLGFKPKLSLQFKGSVHRRAHPTVIANLKPRPGDANIARAQVELPRAAFLDNAHIGEVCTRPAFAAHSCPAGSVYGRAKAVSPLLDQPLHGNVYLRANPAHELPDLVADLNGQIEVALAGRTDSVKGALRNTFEAVPDAPVSSFRLELFGGKRGLIEMSSGFCRRPKAAVKFVGHNGEVLEAEPVVASSCPKGDKKHRPLKGH